MSLLRPKIKYSLTKGLDDARSIDQCIIDIEEGGRVMIEDAATLVSNLGGRLDTLARLGGSPHEALIYIALLQERAALKGRP